MGARRCTAQVFFHSRLPRVAPFWSDCVAIGRRDVKGWVGEDRLDMSSSSFMKTLKKRARHGCKDPRVSSLGRCDDNIVHSIGCSDFYRLCEYVGWTLIVSPLVECFRLPIG